MSFLSSISNSLRLLDSSGLCRDPILVSSAHNSQISVNGSSFLSLCSNNYLGLANHPSISLAVIEALKDHGFGSGSSRLISGTMNLHRTAEKRLSDFIGLPRSLLFSSGYSANLGTIQSLVGPSDVVFSDALNHASIIDGCRLSRAKIHIFHHRDLDHLHFLLSQHRSDGDIALVVSESVFSMDGDVAFLPELRELSNFYDAGLYIDEAHSLGVFGKQGRGLCFHHGVVPDVFIGTLGKAFGTQGAFVSGENDIIRFIENRARSFVFSTAPSPVLSAAIIAATNLVESSDSLRSRLFSHANRLRDSLVHFGYPVLSFSSPIIPVLCGNPHSVMSFSSRLFDHKIFVHGIRPPTVPEGTCRLRIIPTASFSDVEIDLVIDTFRHLYPFFVSIVS